MHFIEQLLGISPDAGTGSTEFMFLLVPLFVTALVLIWRNGRRA